MLVPIDVGGHQVGRELDARELQVQRLGQRPHQHGLAQARHAFQQRMAARDHADQHMVNHIILPDDDLAHLVDNRRCGIMKLLNTQFFANYLIRHRLSTLTSKS